MRYRLALAIGSLVIASASFAQMNGSAAGDKSRLSRFAFSEPSCIPGARCPSPLVPSYLPLQPFVPPVPNTVSPIDTDCRILPTQIERDHCVNQKLDMT
jgi:hypothetical protein